MLTKYKEWAWVRWKGWVLVLSALAILFVNAPCMLTYDILAGSWGGS